MKGVRLAALGTGTADRLTRRGLKVDLRAPEYNVDAALGPIRTGGRADGLRVLMPRADIGRDPLADELRRSGAEVTEVAAYRVVRIDAEAPDNPDIYRMLLEKQVDVVTFTSASTVRALVDLYGAEPMADLLAQVTVASIGPVTAEAAERYGIRSAIVPAESDDRRPRGRHRALLRCCYRGVSGASNLSRSTVPGGSSTSFPGVAATVPPAPMRMPASAPLNPPRMPPMIAPTAAPVPILPTSPLMPSLSSACVTVARIG